MISARLKMWVESEAEKGWTTKTCEEEKHCYILNVCQRVREKIDLWEKNLVNLIEKV